MSLVKDLVDLATQLDNSISDRKIRELFLPLKEQLLAVERDQFELERRHTQEMAQLNAEHDHFVSQLKANHAAEVANLQAVIQKLQEQQGEFVEHYGAMFKRKPGGGYHHAVYCPDCKGPMVSRGNLLPFNCAKCKRTLNFAGEKLQQVLAELS
jgi:ribosomal protein L37AE/L43A